MNNLLNRPYATDSPTSGRAFVALPPSSFVGTFASERLKAFKTRFSPSKQRLGDFLSGVGLTAGLYAAIAVAIRQLSTADLAPVLQAFHLNGV